MKLLEVKEDLEVVEFNYKIINKITKIIIEIIEINKIISPVRSVCLFKNNDSGGVSNGGNIPFMLIDVGS